MAPHRRGVDDYRDAVTRSDLPSSAKLVAQAMSRYMHFTTLAGAYPGPYRVAKEVNLSVRTVKRLLAMLVERGWLEKTHIGGSFPTRQATIYRGRIPRATSDSPDTGQRATTSDNPDTGQRSTTGVRDDTGTSDKADTPTVPKGTDRNRGGALRPAPNGPAPAPRRESFVVPIGRNKGARSPTTPS